MNNKLLVGIIVIFILGIGGHFLINSQKDTSNNPVVQSHRSYNIEITSDISSIQPNKKAAIKYKIKNDKGEILKKYEVAHEKIMHFITVRKDLQYFQHLHPDFNKSTDEFSIEITFPQEGVYRLFPDFTPGLDNPQKLSVTVYQDVDVGNSNEYYAQSVVRDTESKKTYDGYDITFDFPKDVQKGKEVGFGISIAKNGKPVTNLENYLGALGHSVVLKEETLDFIHTHALEATNSSVNQGHGAQPQHGSIGNAGKGPKINFATIFPESGVYKIFTQFQHEGKTQTVDYTVEVK